MENKKDIINSRGFDPAVPTGDRADNPTPNKDAPPPDTADTKTIPPVTETDKEAPAPEADPPVTETGKEAPAPDAEPLVTETNKEAPAPDADPPVTETGKEAPPPDAEPPVTETDKEAPPPDAEPPVTEINKEAPAPDADPPVTEINKEAPAPDADPPVPVLHLPKFSIILFAIAAAGALVYAAAVVWPPFADFFSRYPGAFVRAVTAYATGWIPFSFAEFLLIFLPVIIFFLMRLAVKKYSGSWRNTGVYVGILLSVVSIFFSIFALGFGTAYHGSTLDKKLGLDRRDVSSEELYITAQILAAKVNEEAENVSFLTRDFSIMPFSLSEMNDKLIAAYDKVCDEHDFIQRLNSRVKPVMLSEAMSYTHITGVYTYFTGEANINIVFPDYTLPFTAAHELAHQRGIAREDEANFVAFLVCIASDDPYIRYSGYLNLYEYVSSSLYSADADLYVSVASTVEPAARYEMSAYSKFYNKYRHSKAATISHAINDTYLKIQGTEGTKSYGMVTDLAVAYYKTHN